MKRSSSVSFNDSSISKASSSFRCPLSSTEEDVRAEEFFRYAISMGHATDDSVFPLFTAARDGEVTEVRCDFFLM